MTDFQVKDLFNSHYYSSPLSTQDVIQNQWEALWNLERAICVLRHYDDRIVTFADCKRLIKIDLKPDHEDLIRDVEAFKTARKVYLLRTLELGERSFPNQDDWFVQHKSNVDASLRAIDPHLVDDTRYGKDDSLLGKIRDYIWYFFNRLYTWWTQFDVTCYWLAQREILIWAEEQDLLALFKPSLLPPDFSLIIGEQSREETLTLNRGFSQTEREPFIERLDQKETLENLSNQGDIHSSIFDHSALTDISQKIEPPKTFREKIIERIFMRALGFTDGDREKIEALFLVLFPGTICAFDYQSSGHFEIQFDRPMRGSFTIPQDKFLTDVLGLPSENLAFISTLRKEKVQPLRDFGSDGEQILLKIPDIFRGFVQGFAFYPNRISIRIGQVIRGQIIQTDSGPSIHFADDLVSLEVICSAPNPVNTRFFSLADIEFSLFVDLKSLMRVGQGQVRLGITPKSKAMGLAGLLDQLICYINSSMLGGKGRCIQVPPSQGLNGEEVCDSLELPTVWELQEIFPKFLSWL